jgi:predicted nuclease of predicted toxin-antitoxin system
MNFLLDENEDRRLIPYLKALGYDASVIGEDYPASIPDREVLAIAFRERRILITDDVGDFGKLIFQENQPHCGVILFRLKEEAGNIHLRKKQLSIVLQEYAESLHQFIVVTPERVRIREAETERAA